MSTSEFSKSKKAPLVNYPEDGFIVMTTAEYRRTHRDYKGVLVEQATVNHGAYEYRAVLTYKGITQVYLTDAKRVDKPAPTP